MATKRRIPLNRVESVAAGSTATIDLPRNVRYHGIALEYQTSTAGGATQANLEAEIKEVRLNIDEVTQRKFSAKELFAINKTKGKQPTIGDATKPGYLAIFFSEPQRETMQEREATAWGMLGVGDFQIEVDIVDAGQTATLKGFALVDDVQEAPQGIVKMKRNIVTVGATGELPYSLNTERGDSYQGLFFFETAAGDIDDLLLEWDGVKMHQLTDSQQTALIEQFADGYETVSGLYHIPLDQNHPADALRTVKEVNGNRIKVQELLATLNMGAANNVTVISEVVGLPD